MVLDDFCVTAIRTMQGKPQFPGPVAKIRFTTQRGMELVASAQGDFSCAAVIEHPHGSYCMSVASTSRKSVSVKLCTLSILLRRDAF